jgi:hypothetical protein
VCDELERTLKVNIRAVSYLIFTLPTFHKRKEEEEETYENSELLARGRALRPLLGP